MDKLIKQIIILFCVIAPLFGCSSQKAFTTSAQAGDTVALAIGWYPQVRRQDLTVTITDALGAQVTYLPNDPAVRAVVNLYPDPVSKFIVNSELGKAPVATDVFILQSQVTNGDKEFSMKFVAIDLPTTLATGAANISFASSQGDTINPLTVEILPGLGSSNSFENYEGFAIFNSTLRYMERKNYYTVDFAGTAIPHAIQIDLNHDPDVNNGGVGEAFVTPARADLKHTNWSDNGTDLLRVILMPSNAGLTDIQHFKFYVAGELTGLLVSSVSAFDINGDPVSGVTANITASP